MTQSLYENNLEILSEFGILRDEVSALKLRVAQATSGSSLIKQKPVVMTNDDKKSLVQPRFIVVENVAQLKRIGGIPDERFSEGWEHGITMPQPANKATLSTRNRFHPDICAALRVFVYGDSRTVAEYEDIINELRFPMAVANFVAEDVVVTKDSPLVFRDDEGLGNPISVTFRKVTIYRGGQIIWEAPGKLTCDKMVLETKEGPDLFGVENDPVPNNLVFIGSKGGDGGDGADSPDIGKASDGSKSKSGKSSCDRSAGKGNDGGDGADGADGTDGTDGGDAEEVFYDVLEMEGTYIVGSYGGDGGKGGNGGKGGKGGDGGDGGASSDNCSQGKGGDGGNGGDGGKGGNGGNAGNGASIMITYQTGNPTFQLAPNPTTGGKAGDSGAPGALGNGGKGSPGGENGDNGNNPEDAKAGEAGKVGQIFINGKALG